MTRKIRVKLGRYGFAVLWIELKLPDMWVGLFWRVRRCQDYRCDGHVECVEAWLCFLPCIPICVYYRPANYCRADEEHEEVPF